MLKQQSSPAAELTFTLAGQWRQLGFLTLPSWRRWSLQLDFQRPSIIRPPPGRYVNVGVEDGFRSSSCLVRLTSCSSGRSTTCALHPRSAEKRNPAITDLNRIILSSHSTKKGISPLEKGIHHRDTEAAEFRWFLMYVISRRQEPRLASGRRRR
jgi:hypothetical protein